MMRKLTNIFFSKPFILFLTLSFSANAESFSYSWFNKNLTLPFPKEWVANKDKRKQSRDPYVFFEKSGAPRISATLYHTNFELNPKDYSAFQDQLLKSKMKWIKKQESSLIGKIETNPLKSGNNGLSYRFAFKGPRGTFREVGQFRHCSNVSFTLKALVPQEKWDSEKGKEIQNFLMYEDPCPASKNSQN